jgi:hypothetical protein
MDGAEKVAEKVAVFTDVDRSLDEEEVVAAGVDGAHAEVGVPVESVMSRPVAGALTPAMRAAPASAMVVVAAVAAIATNAN